MRNQALDRLALGSNCPRCGAGADEECVALPAREKTTNPHQARVDRAVRQYQQKG